MPIFSQSFCATEPGANAIGALPGGSIGNPSIPAGPYYLKIYVHVIRDDNGNGGQTVEDVREALAILDQDFNPHNIFFVWDCEIDYIDDNKYYDDLFISIFQVNRHLDGIDIWLHPDHIGDSGGQGRSIGIPSDGFYTYGSFFEPPFDIPLADTKVLSHEMGHCLGLYHTHNPNDLFVTRLLFFFLALPRSLFPSMLINVPPGN